MDIPQKIDAILDERKKILPTIENALERVKNARSVVERLDLFRSSQNDMPELAAKLAGIDSKPFLAQQEKVVHQLEQLRDRFARDEIKICFVGRARQGKSLVLQRISGLENDVIPSSDGSHCTGTRSIISNRPNKETTAEIDFFSEQEYVEIVNSYLKEIFNGTVPMVSSAAGIKSLDLSELKKDVSFDQSIRWDRFEKLVEHVGEFQGRFSTRVTVSKSEIESYVAQYNHKNKNILYHTCLGVKQANIFAPFPFAQCGKIVLVDTIGTGDVALGIEDDMLTAVKDSDAIILMLRPDPMAGVVFKGDFETVTSIARAVTPEYTEKMLFWLLNRVDEGSGENSDRIPAVIKQISDQHLPIAQCLNVNCSNPNDVEKNLLIPVLEAMSENLSSIDRMIIERTNQQLEKLEQFYRTISIRVERAMGASVNKDERREFKKRIDAINASVTNDLQGLYLKKDKEKTLSCTSLKEDASEKLRNIRTSVPTKDKIMQQLNNGMIKKFNALEILTDRLRLKIINDFLDLDSSLHEIVLDMKRDVVSVLADKGRLRSFVEADTNDPNRWIKTF